MQLLNLFFLMISYLIIACSLFLWGKNYNSKNTNLHTEKGVLRSFTEREWILFASLLLFSLLVRIWQFGDIPGGINQDGAMAAVDAKALADYGTDRFGMHMPVHFTAWDFGQMSVLLSYCMIPFIKLFGLSTVTIRLPILIASMAGLVAIYFIVRFLVGVEAAQITLLLASLNPWHYMQSRWAIDCNMFPHMFVLGMVFLLLGILKYRRCIGISMFFFALCMYSYGISFYTVPIFLLIMGIYLLCKKVLPLKNILLYAGIYLLFSWPIYLTMAINAFSWKTIETPFFTMPYFPNSIRSNDMLFFSDHKITQLLQNISSTICIFTEGDHMLWNSLDDFGAINLCFVPFIFLGLYYIIHLFRQEKNDAKKAGYLTLLCFFGIGIIAGLITANVNINRINILLYGFILFTGIGIYFVYLNRKRLAYLMLPIWLILSVLFWDRYYTTYATEIRSIFLEDFVQAIEYADSSQCTSFVITPDAQGPNRPYVSEILTLYTLDIDAKYFQGKTVDESGLLYSNKFAYISASQTTISPDAPIAYVITSTETYLFSPQDYSVTQFGNFYTAIPINYMP